MQAERRYEGPSFKELDRSVYEEPNAMNQVVQTYSAYGEQLRASPIIYSLFVFEGKTTPQLSATIAELQKNLPISGRLDNACFLESGVMINYTAGGKVDALPAPGSSLETYGTSNALLMWFLMNSRYLIQARMPHVNLIKYLGADFTF